MRIDVSKIISERPRSGRTWESKTPRQKAITLDPLGDQFDESGNHIRQKRQKYRQPRFNVLERFLIHRVGQPWDKVYSEACMVSDRRSFLGAELRDYLKKIVATECWLDGRKLMHYDWQGHREAVAGLYVHPKTRVLLRAPQPARKPAASNGPR